jgi:hypothetical protein
MNDQSSTQPQPSDAGTPAAGAPAAGAPASAAPEVVEATGSVQQITAQTVNLSNGGAGMVRGENVTVSVSDGGIGMVQAKHASVSITSGGLGVAMAQDLTVQGGMISIAAARNLGGDVKVMFDLRAGLLAGAVIGLVLAAVKLLACRRG